MTHNDVTALGQLDEWCRANQARWTLEGLESGNTYVVTIVTDEGRKRFSRNGRAIADAILGALERAER